MCHIVRAIHACYDSRSTCYAYSYGKTILFACYIADLPNSIKTGCLAYADDVKIFHRIKIPSDTDALQADLDSLSKWSKTWHLKLNPVKCKTVSFTLRKAPVLRTYVLDGHPLERCEQMRDLGVVLDSKLTFADHVTRL